MCNVQMLLEPKNNGGSIIYIKERSQFKHFSGLLCSKLIFNLHKSRFLHTFTLYNPFLIKMCSVQSIDDADAS